MSIFDSMEVGLAAAGSLGTDSIERTSSRTDISSLSLEVCLSNLPLLRGVGIMDCSKSESTVEYLRFLGEKPPSDRGLSSFGAGVDALLSGSLSTCGDQPLRTARSQVRQRHSQLSIPK